MNSIPKFCKLFKASRNVSHQLSFTRKLSTFSKLKNYFDYPKSQNVHRKITIALLPSIPLALFLQDKVTDTALALLTTLHIHQ